MLRAVAGVRGLVAAADPFGVELMHVLINDTDIDDNVRRPENTVPGAWATVESCDITELLLASLNAGVPFSCRVNGSCFAIARERIKQQFAYRDGEITKKKEGTF
ncbi:Os07g0231050 [Oryza sativa Japonica Group]|uniref:Os07g0231050 protein n=2 Tax=Oryza sativa subsp. japonica TaxID=39947 RepID=A0A0P0X464_ORYSJ|nr:hypothetical protein OsJ_23617 [Oryza sativa Japonica Group]BAC55845.1 membrane-associated salt-inducible protein-like [Oryza sativa Japonica Group]BAT00709.1 Os07g0231050 [Oryza sativa Japonica Group]